MMQMRVLFANTMGIKMLNLYLFSTLPPPFFCGNARIAVIVEILPGLQQLLENLSELFTIPWKTLRVSHITTKSSLILMTGISIYRRTRISVYRTSGKTPYQNTGIST